MADNISGWDSDDFLDGDIDFDLDFDNPSSEKGVIASFVSGILSGAKDKTIGSTDAQVRTLRRILPPSFGTFFNTADLIAAKTKIAVKEFKENSAGMMDDLTFISGSMAEKLRGKLPNKITDGLERFSEKDFSSWEAARGDTDDLSGMEETTNEEIASLMRQTMEEQSALHVETSALISHTFNNAMSKNIAASLENNKALIGIDASLKQIYEYQTKVQSRNDAIKINLLTRMHLTNAKYYRFMEAAMHRQIQELKDVVKYSQMSDYQKMTTLDAAKKSIRDSIFSTTIGNFGGMKGALSGIFSKDKINSIIEAGGSVTGDVRMGIEMMDAMGGGGNMSETIGKLVGGMLVEKGPDFFKYGKGKKLIDWVRKTYPETAKEFDRLYSQLDSIGDVASYVSVAGLGNATSHVMRNGRFEKSDETYEGYLATLPKGARKMSKLEFKALQTSMNLGGGLLNFGADAMYDPTGTSYQLKQKSLKDLIAPATWTRQSDRTLTEVIPKMLSVLIASNESIRLAVKGPEVERMTYDFRNSRLITDKNARREAVRSVLNKQDFGSYADNIKGIASSIDSKGELSKRAQTALGMTIADLSDKQIDFNPYDYIGMETNKYVDEATAKEIDAFMRKKFGITDNDLDIVSGNTLGAFAHRNIMPTKDGKRLVHEMANRTKTSRAFNPNISEMIDLQIGLGNEDALRDAGLIEGYGNDRSVSRDRIMQELFNYISGEAGTDSGNSSLPESSKGFFKKMFGNKGSSNWPNGGHQPTMDTMGKDADESLSRLIIAMEDSAKNFERMAGSAGVQFDMSKTEGLISESNLLLTALKELNEQQLTQLTNLVKRTPVTDNVDDANLTTEERAARKEKKGLLDRLKSFGPRNLFNKGVEGLLNNQPLVLGGLLGGLAVTAMHDPRAAMLIGGGAIAMGLYGKLGDMAKASGSEPNDNEDIYASPDDVEPLLRANKLKSGDYYDVATGKLINSWSSIKSGVKLLGGQIVATAKELSGKLFGPDGRAVMLKGLNWAKDMAVKAYKFLDPLGNVKKFGAKVGRYFYQMDVYRAGDKEPTLYRSGFQRGEYYCEKDNDLVEINGWNEIEGPVYDQMMNVLLTQNDIDNGLVTSAGVKIENLKKTAGVMGTGLLRGMRLLKDKVAAGGKQAYGKAKEALKEDYSPITDRLDLIYGILCKKFGYEPERITVNLPGGGVGNAILDKIEEVNPETNPDSKSRTGSLADKARIKREEKREKVEDSIIGISDALNGKDDKDKKDKKEGGLFSKILGFLKNPISSIASLFGKGALGLVGAYFTMMVKGVPLMFKSVELIATGVWKLGGLLTSLVKNLFGWGGASDDIYIDENGKKRKKDKNQKKGKEPKAKKDSRRGWRGAKGSRAGGFGRLAKGGAIAMGANMAFGAARDAFDVEEDSLADDVLTMGEYAATGYGYYTMAAGAASMMGYSLPGAIAAGAGALGTGVAAAGSAAMSGLSIAAPLLFNPITLGVLAVGAVGYGIWAYYNRGKGSQYPLRIAQYGFKDEESDVAIRIRKLEDDLKDYVQFSGGSAAFSKSAPLDKMFKPFLDNPNNPKETSELYAWFNHRFKPVYLIYMGALKQSGFKSLEEYDESTEPRVYQTAKQVHRALLGWVPCPYEVTTKIDKDIPTLDKPQTLKLVEEYFVDMQKYNERHGLDSEGKVIVEETKMKTLDEQVKESEEAGFWKSSWMWLNGDYVDQKDIDEINAKFPIDKLVKEANISDMLPGGDKPLDTLTALRLAAYGNHENKPWRVEAVLRLERHMETQVNMIGKDIRFIGKTGEIYNLFKSSFRIETDKEGNKWLLWFRDRFLPVYLVWHREVFNNRHGIPSKVWRTLSNTTRFNIANKIIDAKGLMNGNLTSIWDLNWNSPFPGSYIRKGMSSEVKDWIKQLDYEAVQAKLKDPKAEAAKTGADAVVEMNEITDRNGLSEGAKNQQGADSINNLNDLIASATGVDQSRYNHYSADPVSFYGGNADYKAIQYDVNEKIDNSGVQSLGADKGISIPRDTAIKYIMREMAREGFTDPRQIAEMLALTHYETGGYARTAENMVYTDPVRARGLFSRLSGMSNDDIRRLSQQGPQAFANKVYGGWMGNNGPNDGWLYRGRGLVQLTGLDNYRKAAQDLGIDIVNNPQWVSENPEVMARTAVWYFKNNKQLQSIKENGDFHYAARGLNNNKALPGMEKRFALYKDYLAKVISGQLKPGEMGSPTTGADGAPSGAMFDPTLGNANVQSRQTDVERINTPKIYAPPAGMETNAYDGEDGSGGFTPPSTFNPQTGNGAADAFVHTKTTMDVASNQRSSNYGNLKLKSSETVEGGPSHPGIIRLAEEIQKRVPNFRYFSALNDGYHQKLPSNSAHKRGMALDFTVTNGVNGSDQATAITIQILESAGLKPKTDYLVINEYRRKTKYGNGGHVHANFVTDKAASQFVQAMGPGVAKQGGMVEALQNQPTDPNGQAMPASQNIPSPSPTDPLAAGVRDYTQTRNDANNPPPETAAREEPMQGNRQQSGNPGTTETPGNPNDRSVGGIQQPSPAMATQEVNVQAMKPETETAVQASAAMMAKMVEQLVLLNKNVAKQNDGPDNFVHV